jgi:hypothetical protein
VNILPPNPATRLRRFIAGLCDLLGRQLPRQADPLPGFLVWQWLRRLAHRLDTLAARPPAPPRFACPAPVAGCRPGHASLPATAAPRRRGWLLELSPDFAGQGEALRQMLADRQIQALLQAAPRLQPALARLLRLLGTDFPAAPRRPAPVAIRPARPDRETRDRPEDFANPRSPVTVFAKPA